MPEPLFYLGQLLKERQVIAGLQRGVGSQGSSRCIVTAAKEVIDQEALQAQLPPSSLLSRAKTAEVRGDWVIG